MVASDGVGGAQHYEVRPPPTSAADDLRLLRHLARAYPAVVDVPELWWKTRRVAALLATGIRGWGSVRADRRPRRRVTPEAWLGAGAESVYVSTLRDQTPTEAKVALQFQAEEGRGSALLTLQAPGGGVRVDELPGAAARWLEGLGSLGDEVRARLGVIGRGPSVHGDVDPHLARALLASDAPWRGPDVDLEVVGATEAIAGVAVSEEGMLDVTASLGSVDDPRLDAATSAAADDFMRVRVECAWTGAAGGYNSVDLLLNTRLLGLEYAPGTRQVVVCVNYKTDLYRLRPTPPWVGGDGDAAELARAIGRAADVDLHYIGAE